MNPANRRQIIWDKEKDTLLLDSPFTEEIITVFNQLKIKY